jgi:hypothetical protein
VPFLTSGSLFSTSIGTSSLMNSLITWPTPYGLQLVSCPILSPSSASASLLKPYDLPSPGHSSSPCDRSIPSFSPCDRQNLSPTSASDRPTASLSREFRQSLSLCDRSFSGSVFRPCDRQNHSLTFASESFAPRVRQTGSPSLDFRQSLSLCDHLFSGSVFSPCDRSTHGLSDRPPQCKTLSLRRESAKRSACLSTVPSVQTFGATWPNDAACDSFLPEIAVRFIRQGFQEITHSGSSSHLNLFWMTT